MLNRKFAMIAGAAIAASTPALVNAVAITYTIETGSIEYSLDGGNTYLPAVVTGTAANPVATVPANADVEFNVDGAVTGDANPAAGGAYSTAHAGVVPANLGLAAYQIGITDSNKTVASVLDNGIYNGGTATGVSTAAVNANFSVNGPGNLDGNGGITPATGTVGSNLAPADTTVGAGATLGYGGLTAANLYSSLVVDTNTASGSSVFQLVAPTGLQGYFTNTAVGSSKVAPTYAVTGVGGADTVTAGSLTIVVAGAVTATTQNIISLTTAAPTSYNQSVASLTVSGTPSGGYLPASATVSAATGYYGVTYTNTPTSGTEVYALKLSSAAQDATIIALINTETASSGVTASAPTGQYATDFPGYDIVLSGTGLPKTSYLGFDLSQDAAATTAGITVTGVAAVPEPATTAGLVIGAAGLLLGRRKARVA